MQLEEGYIQAKAWTITGDNVKRRSLQPGSVSTERRSSGSAMSEDEGKAKKSNAKDKRTQTELEASSKSLTLPNLQNQRLFGQYMSSMVTYQDATTAWLMSDDFFARMSSTVYQRFAGGAHMSGTKLTRGHNNAVKSKEQAPKPKADSTAADSVGNDRPEEADVTEQKPSPAQRKLFETASRAKESAGSGKAAPSEEEQDGSMLEDYRDTHGEDQARPIDHLLFVTHGIGQKLGLRMESVNFIHDCNNLRKTLKAVYASSADLQALNSEDGKTPGNCRVQVLPVCWRHMLDFPKSAVKHNRGESDIGTGGEAQEDEKYPSLADITVEGVPAVRSLISDLGLDILLYQSAYRDLIATNVLRECNRIHDLFCKRNPEFKGKVSLVGHSLGSAIFFDILCDQKDKAPVKIVKKSSWTHRRSVSERPAKHHPNDLKFPVENMFSLGSPIGLFQMLKGRTIAARACKRDDVNATSTTGNTPETSNAFSVTVSSPKVGQFFNIFHPTDPIAYRIEPLISTAMATLKPQPIPYTKKGLFDAQIGQLGLGQIGARVGSSVSNLWSSMTTNIASNVLNRSLGFTGEAGGYHTGETATASRMSLVQPPGQPGGAAALSAGAGTNILGGGVLSPDPPAGSGSDDKKRALAERTMQGGGRRDGVDAKTLIDDEIETLYSGFQKRGKKERSRSRARDTSEAEADASLKEVMLRREERKVKALNSTGRVDFSIQERFYDISLLQSIASHLAYWQDEDVWHLALGQMLSKHQASGDQGLREELDRFEAKRP